jgi:LAO/AO transport system kinase
LRTRRLAVEQYVSGVLAGHRPTLAQAITVIESDLPSDNELSAKILDALLPHTGKSRRIGLTGIPGVGKSTFLDKIGMHIVRERGEKLAVLSIDPSSPLTGGSILGDKTRMEQLSAEPDAFIRPSPSRGSLGGVAARTRETVLLCEAAGFENIWIETMGVGQSEIAVRAMTDFVLLLLLPGAGDELQGIKRGILELVDAIAINKADGSQLERAKFARAEYQNALHLFAPGAGGWSPPVLLCSAQTGMGIVEIWDCILKQEQHQVRNGLRAELRRQQALAAMRQMISLGLEAGFRRDPKVQELLPQIEEMVLSGKMTSFAGARSLLSAFRAAARHLPETR